MPPSIREWLIVYMSALPTGLNQVTNELQSAVALIIAQFITEHAAVKTHASKKVRA